LTWLVTEERTHSGNEQFDAGSEALVGRFEALVGGAGFFRERLDTGT
jgi:hypothetical protein